MSKALSLKDIIDAVGDGYELTNERDHLITGVAPIEQAKTESVTFCSRQGENAFEMVGATLSPLVIVRKTLDVDRLSRLEKTFIRVDNPRLEFIRVLHKYFVPSLAGATIHPTAVIGTDVELGDSVSIGPNVVIESGCSIAAGTRIGPGVAIHRGTRVGTNVIIHAGVVIGTPGFGYEYEDDGSPLIFPQIGGVVIGDDVEIGANTCVDRGALGDTMICAGTKIDNMVHVAHNAQLGKNCMVVAHAGIGGSVTIGEGTWVGFGAKIKEQLTVGENSLLGMGAVVIHDVPDGVVVVGSPARILRDNV